MRKVSGDTEYTKTKREKWVKQKLHTVDQSVYNKVKFKKGQTDDTKSTIDKGATKHRKNSLNNDKNNDINDNKKAPEQQSTSSSTTCTKQINTQKQRIERKKGTDKNLESNNKIKKKHYTEATSENRIIDFQQTTTDTNQTERGTVTVVKREY
jgi:hypothetical protein